MNHALMRKYSWSNMERKNYKNLGQIYTDLSYDFYDVFLFLFIFRDTCSLKENIDR